MILDSSAWIEFFQGTEKGKKVELVLKSDQSFTSIVTISEVVNWSLKNNFDSNMFIEKIEKISKIIPLNKEIVILAGKLNFENKKKIKNWGMLDSFIYSTALTYNLKVLTGDNHFYKLNNVEMI